MLETVFSYINYFIIRLLFYIRAVIQIASQEDEYHLVKKDRSCFMYVHIVTKNQAEYDDILEGVLGGKLSIILTKYQVTLEDLITDKSHIMNLHYKYPTIVLGINHYYIGGTDYLNLLISLYESKDITWPETDFMKAVYALPSYIQMRPYLVKRNYPLLEKERSYRSSYASLIPKHKRAYIVHRLLSSIYEALQLDRPMLGFITMAFKHCEGINNNVGGFFIIYEPSNTVMDIHEKIQKNGAQCYLTNSIAHFPKRKSKSNFRYFIDCILTMGHVYSEYNFETYLQLYGPPQEQVYCSCLSNIKSDNTVNFNVGYITASANFKPTKKMKLIEYEDM